MLSFPNFCGQYRHSVDCFLRLKRGVRPNSGGASTRIGQASSDRDILCRWREHFVAVANGDPS